METNLKGIDFMDNYIINKEVWKDVKGYEGYYQVSNFGRVKSVPRIITYVDGRVWNYNGKMLSTRLNRDGYPCLGLVKDTEQKHVRVHRLVAEAFIDNPHEYLEVNHIDEDKANNHYTNLEWCTRKYNMNHGTGMKRSHSHPNAIKRLEDSKVPIVGINIKTEDEIRFESVNAAGRSGFPRRNVNAAITGSDKSCRGYVWLREDEYTEELKQEKLKPFRIKIKQLDDEGNLINVFDEINQAGKFIGVHPSNISRAISNNRKCKGYKWTRE